MLTYGTLQHMIELDRQAEAVKHDRPNYIAAKLSALNYRYAWYPSLGGNWTMVNRHIWRRLALYQGGDCFLAGWPEAVPHQRLWPWPTLGLDGYQTLPSYRVPKCTT